MKEWQRVLIAAAGALGVLTFALLMSALTNWLNTFPFGKLLMAVANVALLLGMGVWLYQTLPQDKSK